MINKLRFESINRLFLLVSLLLGGTCGFINCYNFGVVFSFISFILFTNLILKRFGYASIAFAFLLFFGLYSYSVPLSVIFNIELSPYHASFVDNWTSVDEALASFSLCVHLALAGMVLAYFFCSSIMLLSASDINHIGLLSRYNYNKMSSIIAILCGSFSLINFYRVGGFSTILQGKLVYQSAIADHSLMLPDEKFFYLSMILGLLGCVINGNSKIKTTIKILIFSFPYVLINLYIGERGTFVVLICLILLVIYYFKKVVHLKYSYLLAAVFIYFFFAVFTVFRSLIGSSEYDNSYSYAVNYLSENTDRIELVLNPANSEFGTSCINFRTYYNKTYKTDPEFKYGTSYVHFLSQLLPQRINPFYDVSETIKFRNKYFLERGAGGSTGGTAFSSIYESFVNFWYIGPFFVYFLIFHFILILERKKIEEASSLFVFLIYVQSFELAMLFQRSSIEYITIKLIWIVIMSFIISFLFRKYEGLYSK